MDERFQTVELGIAQKSGGSGGAESCAEKWIE